MKNLKITIVLILCATMAYAQNEKRVQFLKEREEAAKRLELAKQSNNKDSIKVAKRTYKPYKKLLITGAPVYTYTPQLRSAVGPALSLNYNLDKKMGSPMSNTTIAYLESVDTKGKFLDIRNKFYFNNDTWRLNTWVLDVTMELPVALGPDLSTTATSEGGIYQIQGYRKAAKNLYVGLQLEYNKIETSFESILPTSESETFTPGLLLDYDTRDNVMYPSKGFFSTNLFALLHHGLAYEASIPGSFEQYEDPVGYFLIGTFNWYYSPIDSWKSTLSVKLGYDMRLGDTGSAIWQHQAGYQRGFKSQSVTGNRVLVLNAEYAHFFDGILKGRFGLAGFGAYGMYGQDGLSTSYRVNPTTGLGEGSAISGGLGLRYMLLPKEGVVFRVDWGIGAIPGSDLGSENSFNISIGKYF